jgi:hypothetical protein
LFIRSLGLLETKQVTGRLTASQFLADRIGENK